ncbi:MAG: SUMF1/EgtB/PvdO family nonheme iron enzyme [Candidatus Didemnitutus sp.]|nr:SUMF1/EgtB/PvdO family nonheme iron enzyme [Candidatus Didemnitutus sp.]
MIPFDAAKLLELPVDATPETIEARFLDLRTKFEDKIAKAPTPGLKAKYRESLDQITTAFETLTLASDSSSLPVLKKESGDRSQETGGSASPRAGSPGGASLDDSRTSARPHAPAGKKKSSSKEFILVAVIAIALLAGGSWFILKTRAENAEKARVAAEQKAVEAREKERLERLAAAIRTQVAELRIAWDALEQQARALERKIGDLKGEERNLNKGQTTPELAKLRAELVAHEELLAWLGQQLLRHPAKVARAQGEELLSARQVDDSAATIARAAEEQAKLVTAFEDKRRSLLSFTGSVSIRAAFSFLDWKLTDAYGAVHTGKGSAPRLELPLGELLAEFTAANYRPRTFKATVRPDQPLVLEPDHKVVKVTLDSYPQGAEIWLGDERLGTTPLRHRDFSAGKFLLELRRAGHIKQSVTLALEDGWEEHTEEVRLLRLDEGVPGFDIVQEAIGIDIKTDHFVHGVRVNAVVPDGPAARAGLTATDWIVSVSRRGSKPVLAKGMESVLEMHAALSGQPGDEIVLKVAKLESLLAEETAGERELRLRLVTYAELIRPKRGKPYRIPGLEMELLPVSPGTFVMGNPSEPRSLNTVTLTQPFWLGRFEVTQGQWNDIMNPGENVPEEWKRIPSYNKSWNVAMEFCRRLTIREREAGRLPEGHSYTLPTSAQWEYASRAGDTGYEPRNLSAMAWFGGGKDSSPKPVGTKAANAWGFHDMLGNVEELCLDRSGHSPGGQNLRDPQGPENGQKRVDRGGNWYSKSSWCVYHDKFSSHDDPDYHSSFNGLRVALVPAPPGSDPSGP